MLNVSRRNKIEKNKIKCYQMQLVTSPWYKLGVMIYDDNNHWDRNFRLVFHE